MVLTYLFYFMSILKIVAYGLGNKTVNWKLGLYVGDQAKFNIGHSLWFPEPPGSLSTEETTENPW